jgi:hypothetical protein
MWAGMRRQAWAGTRKCARARLGGTRSSCNRPRGRAVAETRHWLPKQFGGRKQRGRGAPLRSLRQRGRAANRSLRGCRIDSGRCLCRLGPDSGRTQCERRSDPRRSECTRPGGPQRPGCRPAPRRESMTDAWLGRRRWPKALYAVGPLLDPWGAQWRRGRGRRSHGRRPWSARTRKTIPVIARGRVR